MNYLASRGYRGSLVLRCAVLLVFVLATGCARAPSFDIVGSFFPAWLVCLAIAVVLTGVTAWLLRRLKIPLALPTLTYPSLTAVFTFALWLVLFRG